MASRECMDLASRIAQIERDIALLRRHPKIGDLEGPIAQFTAELNQLHERQKELGCIKPPVPLPTVEATFQGTATEWNDSGRLTPKLAEAFSVPIEFTKYPFGWSIADKTLSVQFGSTKVTLQDDKIGFGQLDPTTGAMELRLPLRGKDLVSLDENIDLKSNAVIEPPNEATPIVGRAVDKSGNVTLVGRNSTYVAALAKSVTFWLELQGQLSQVPR